MVRKKKPGKTKKRTKGAIRRSFGGYHAPVLKGSSRRKRRERKSAKAIGLERQIEDERAYEEEG